MSPRPSATKTPLQVWLVVIATYLAGFAALENVLFHHVVQPFNAILPVELTDIPHASSVVLGICLIYFANQLHHRKHMAYILSITGLLLLILMEVVWFKDISQLLLYVLLFALLLLNRRYFFVRSDSVRLKSSLQTIVVLVGILLLYGTLGFLLMDERGFGQEFSILQSFSLTIRELFTFSGSVLAPHTLYAREFLYSLDIAGFMVLILSLAALFTPLRYRLAVSKRDHDLAENILRKWSDSTEDYFKLWPHDKHYFFEAGHRAFIAYKVARGTVLVLDGPSGDPSVYGQMWNDFMEFTIANDWRVAIIHSSAHEETIYKAYKFKKMFIGNEALVKVDDFMESTVKNKHFRYVKNKATRDNLEVEIWPAPLNTDQLTQLKQVSDNWLSRDRREYTFIMGYFDEHYLENCTVATLKKDGKVIAYTNLVPCFISGRATIDQMRHEQEASPVAMHFLLMQLLKYLHSQGTEYFNLGLVPLAGMSSLSNPSASERLVTVLIKVGAKYYSTEGLEQFKNKFEPKWEPRYVFYQGSVQNLVAGAVSLNKAIAYSPHHTKHSQV